ncbi:MAG: NAD-dependent succinate-semialdehyde dehydrogenase [Candidatus Scalinduaceae bacterium]
MTVTTINPATEEVIKDYSLMSRKEVMVILDYVHKAFVGWKTLPVQQRASYFAKVARVLRNNKEKYAQLITQEMGKPVTEARAEIEKCVWTAEIYAENGERWLQEQVLKADGKEHRVVYQPLGVIFSIMPWNFPFWQAFRFGIPTLLAGNASLLKHASNVTGCALAIEDVFKEAGFPENVFRTVIADHDSVAEIVASNHIAGVSLTGSTSAGKRIGELAGKNLKKVVLELGGSDPFIVLEDADLDKTAEQATVGRFLNCGQSCVAAKRFIVVESVAEDFARKFAKDVKQKVLGNPVEESTRLGPLVSKKAVEQIEDQVNDAVDKGATILTGGKRAKDKGYFYEPTILVNTTKEMKVVKEEVFGPVAPIIVVADEEDAVKVANATEFGLGGSVWTKDIERGKRIARQLECGCAFVNSFVKSDPRIPFGGIKKSGIGRELSKYGLREFVNVKAINVYEP